MCRRLAVHTARDVGYCCDILTPQLQARIAISRTQGRGAVVAAGMDAIKVQFGHTQFHLRSISPRVVLIVFAADFQESKGSSWIGVPPRSAEAAQRKGEGAQWRAI